MNDALQIFMEMNKRDQADFARTYGSFLGLIMKGDLFAYLYSLQRFYAELYYNATSVVGKQQCSVFGN